MKKVVLNIILLALMQSALGQTISVLNKNGGLTSDPLQAVNKYGAKGSGKGLSQFGGITDAPLAPVAVGESYQGGIIFVLFATGEDGIQHGLIRTAKRNYPLVNATTVTWVVNTGLPNDNANNLFGYNDWRLPTYPEATQICSTGVLGIGGMTISSTVAIVGYVKVAVTMANASVCSLSQTSIDGAMGGTRTILVRNF